MPENFGRAQAFPFSLKTNPYGDLLYFFPLIVKYSGKQGFGYVGFKVAFNHQLSCRRLYRQKSRTVLRVRAGFNREDGQKPHSPRYCTAVSREETELVKF